MTGNGASRGFVMAKQIVLQTQTHSINIIYKCRIIDNCCPRMSNIDLRFVEEFSFDQLSDFDRSRESRFLERRWPIPRQSKRQHLGCDVCAGQRLTL